jgi:hypothetical protein
MNKSYQEIVTNELKSLCDFMQAEFDENSPRYYTKHFEYIDKEVGRSIELCYKLRGSKNAVDVFDSMEWNSIISDPWTHETGKMMEKVRDNPFLPKYIREPISKYYLSRCDIMTDLYLNEFIEFRKRIFNVEGAYKEKDLKISMNNHIIDCYSKNRIEYKDVRTKVHLFTEMIYEYFKRTEDPTIFLPQIKNAPKQS